MVTPTDILATGVPATGVPATSSGSSHFSFRTLPSVPQVPSTQLRITDGSPDVRLAPIAQLYQRCKVVAQQSPRRELLRYSDDRGNAQLRQTLSNHLRASRGLVALPDQILITRGSQMGIYLFLRLLLRPGGRRSGDLVIVGENSYPATNQVVRECGGQLVTVPVDTQGIDTEAVAELCRRKTIRALYITSHHHYPTTVTLSADRRVQLLQLAQAHRFAIIEDDYDYDFHYARSPLLPLASLDTQGSVVYVGSFTKCVAPSVRIGYVVAPPNVIQSMATYRRNVDRQGDPVLEQALAGWIEDGELTRHLKKSLKEYRRRRTLFCQLLRTQLGHVARFEPPSGGMAVWTTFAPSVNLETVDAYARQQGIWLDDVNQWKDYHALRLGFASLNEVEMIRGLEVLKSALV